MMDELPDWLAAAVAALQRGDVAGWMELYAADAVHEFPFAPAGGVDRLEGRAAIAAYMAQLPTLLRFGPVDDVGVRQAADETIVEAVGHHRRADDDRPVDLRYIWFITRRDGKVTHIRDYMNPDQLARLTSQDAPSN